MGFKLNPGQKLLIVIAAVLFIAGTVKLVYFHMRPFESVMFGMNNMMKSFGYEQDIQVNFQADPAHWDNQSISANMINDMLITAHYQKTGNALNIDYTLKSNSTQETMLKGALYIKPGLTALTINDKTFYSKKGAQPALNRSGGLVSEMKDYKPYFKYQPGGSVLPINDYGAPGYMVMDNFSLTVEGGESSNLLNAFITVSGISDIIKQTPAVSANKVYALFQSDDFLRLRGIYAEISLSDITADVVVNTNRIGGNISIKAPDITNGTDISNNSEDEINSLFKEFFDSLAGGK